MNFSQRIQAPERPSLLVGGKSDTMSVPLHELILSFHSGVCVCVPGSGGRQTVNLGESGSLLWKSPFSGLALHALSSFAMTPLHSGHCICLVCSGDRYKWMYLFIYYMCTYWTPWWYYFIFTLTLNGYRAHSWWGSHSDFPRILCNKNITYFMVFVRIKCNRLQKALSTGGWHRENIIKCYD